MPRRDGGQGSRNRQGEPWDCSAGGHLWAGRRKMGWKSLSAQRRWKEGSAGPQSWRRVPTRSASLGTRNRPYHPCQALPLAGTAWEAGPWILCGGAHAGCSWRPSVGDAHLGSGSPLKVWAVHLQVYPAYSVRQTLSCDFHNLAHIMCSNHSKNYSFFCRTIW